MEVERFDIPGAAVITPRAFEDARGFFSETYNCAAMREHGFEHAFVQDNHSLSVDAGVLRGLHFQTPPHAQVKLVRVTRGRVLDVIVDIRAGSPTFGRHIAVELSAENRKQLLAPAGVAHGFVTLEPMTEVQYKVTDYYAPDCDAGILWSDPDLGIDWPVDANAVLLSAKDTTHPRLRDFETPFQYRAEEAE